MDISELLSSLSSEDMEQLKNAANAILGNNQPQKQETPQNPLFNPAMIGNLSKLSQALSGDDDRTAFIKALKPMLNESRQQKADEAIKILKLVQLLPLLRESGLFNGLI